MEATALGSIILGVSSTWSVLRGAVPLIWNALNLSSTALGTLAGVPTSRQDNPVLGGVRSRIFETGSPTHGGESTAEIYGKNQRALASVVLLTGGWVLLFWLFFSIVQLVMTGSMRFQQRRAKLNSVYDSDMNRKRVDVIMTYAPTLYASQLLATEAYSNARQSAASDARADTTVSIAGLQLTLIAQEALTFFVTALIAIRDALITSVNFTYLFSRVILIGAFVSITGTLFINYTDVLLTLYSLIWSNGLRPILLDRLLFVLAVIFIVLPFLLIYPFVITILGTQKVFSARFVGKVVVRVSLPQISRGFIGFARALAALIAGLFYWFINRPSSSLIPLDRGIGIFLDTGREILLTAVIPTCVLINYVVGGIVDVLTHPTLTSFLTLLINLPIKFAQTFFWLPIVTGELPPIAALDDHTTTMFMNLGDWFQNATVATGNVFIGNLKDYYFYNATTPPTLFVSDTDSFQYVVRAFGVSIWRAFFTAIAVLIAIPLELLNIALKLLEWFRPGGNSFFTFAMIRDKAHMTIEYVASIINIAPNCYVPGGMEYTIDRVVQYGDLVAGLGRALIAVIYIAKDLILGEIYSVFEGVQEVFLYYSAGYFLANGREIVEYEAGISRLARGLGCAIANIDEGFGIFLENALQIIFDSTIMVALRFVLYIRYAFTKGTSAVLDSLDPAIDRLEADLLDLRKLTWFIYRFANRNSEQCASELDPVCGLASLFENLIQLVAQLIVLVIRSVKSFVKRFVNLFLSGSFGEIPNISFRPLVNTANRVGASLGVFLGTIIQIDIECHQTQPNICAVRFFRQLPEKQTPTICLATFFVVFGGLFGGLVAVIVLWLELLLNLDFLTGSNPAEIIANNSRVIVNLLKKIFFIVKVYVVAPLCPLGHFIDCPLSIFIPDADIASRFLCFINDSIVVLIDNLEGIIVSVIELAFGIFRIIFTGDFSLSTIKSVFDAAWRIFSSAIETTVLLILNSIIGFIFTIIRGICNFFGLRDCVAFIDRIQANLASNGLGTRPSDNYLREDLKKRKAKLEEETKNGFMDDEENRERRKRFARTNLFLDITDEHMRDKVTFEQLKAFGFLYQDGVNVTTGETVWRQRQVLEDDLPAHLANYTAWSPGTKCARFIALMAKKKMSDLSASDQLQIYECIELRAAAISIAASSKAYAWLPEDLFYNKFRQLFVVAELTLSAAVLLEYAFDRSLPHERVMSQDYRDAWAALSLNVSHLDTTFREFYPNKTVGGVAKNASVVDLAQFEIFRQNLTLSEYWYNNFYWPRYKSAQEFAAKTQPIVLENGTVIMPEQFQNTNDLQRLAGVGLVDLVSSTNALFVESTNFVLNALNLQRKHVEYILSLDGNIRTVTNTDMVSELPVNDPCYMMPYQLCVVNGTTNSRYEIWKAAGPEGLNLHDTQKISEGIYYATARFMDGLFSIGDKFIKVATGSSYYHGELDNNNYMKDEYVTNVDPTYTSSTTIEIPLHDPDADVANYYKTKYPDAYSSRKRSAETSSESVSYTELTEEDLAAVIKMKRDRFRNERDKRNIEFQRARQQQSKNTTRTWPTWQTFKDAFWRGTAQRIDRFMHDNDAAYPDHAIERDAERGTVHLKRSVSEGFPDGDESLETIKRKERLAQRSKLSVVVISAVSAASRYVKLNTSHVPIWCNSSRELRQACAYADWQNAAEYLRDDPILYENFAALFNVSVSSVLENLAPRTPEAKLVREKFWDVVSGFADFGGDIMKRMALFVGRENLAEKAQDIHEQSHKLHRELEDERAKRDAKEQVPTAHKRTLQNHPRFAHIFQRVEKYVPIEQQRKEADEWFRTRFGDLLEPQHARVSTGDVDHEEATRKLSERYQENLKTFNHKMMGSHPVSTWMHLAERSLVEDPEKMLTAVPLAGTEGQVRQAALHGDDLWSSSLRAYFGWLSEEKDIQHDYDTYHGLFVPQDDPSHTRSTEEQSRGDMRADSASNRLKHAQTWSTLDSSDLALLLTQRARERETANRDRLEPSSQTALDGKSTSTLAVSTSTIAFKSTHYRCRLYAEYARQLAQQLNETADALKNLCDNPYQAGAVLPKRVTMTAWSHAVVEERIPDRPLSPHVDPEAVVFATLGHHPEKIKAYSAADLARSAFTRVKVLATKKPGIIDAVYHAGSSQTLTYHSFMQQHRLKASTNRTRLSSIRAASLRRPGDSVELPVRNLIQIEFEFDDSPSRSAHLPHVSKAFAALDRDHPKVLTHSFFELDDPVSDANETSRDAAARNNPAGLTLECPFPSSFICDPKFGCYVIAEMALQLKRLVLQFIDLMTSYVPMELVRKLSYLPYAYSSTESARIGFGEYPPYYYARGISPWYYWRGLPSEIAGAQNGTDGPKWSTLVRAVTGGIDFPEFYLTNGTAYRAYARFLNVRANSTLLNQPENSDLRDNFAAYEALFFIQETLGIKFLEFVDTFLVWARDVYPGIVTFALSLVTCNYARQLGCYRRITSIAGAVKLYLDISGPVLAVFFVLGLPGIEMVAMFFAAIFLPWVAVLAWGWSPICSLPPVCSVPDLFDLAVYTAAPRCDVFEGNFISNPNYVSANCFLFESGLSRLIYNETHPQTGAPERTYVNCYDFGFRNEYDGFEAYEVYYQAPIQDPSNPAWQDGTRRLKALPFWLRFARALTDTVYKVVQSITSVDIFKRPQLTRDWKGEFHGLGENIYRDFYTNDDTHYRNQNACADVSIYRSIGLLMLKATSAVIVSVSVFRLLAIFFLGIGRLIFQAVVFCYLVGTTYPTRQATTDAHNYMQRHYTGESLDKTPYAALWDENVKAKVIREAETLGIARGADSTSTGRAATAGFANGLRDIVREWRTTQQRRPGFEYQELRDFNATRDHYS